MESALYPAVQMAKMPAEEDGMWPLIEADCTSMVAGEAGRCSLSAGSTFTPDCSGGCGIVAGDTGHTRNESHTRVHGPGGPRAARGCMAQVDREPHDGVRPRWFP